jgi:hypothetical protein
MSGGHFDYNQYRLHDIARQLEELIKQAEYPDDILAKFKEAHQMCLKTGTMVQRIDWLVSGDDGEETFRERWKEELGEY